MNKKIKLLLVEQDWILAAMITDYVVAEGLEVLFAPCVKEGLQIYYDFMPDICVIAVNVPDREGLNMAKEIRSTDTHTPIIFIGSNVQTSDVLDGFIMGGDDYLKKPFSIQELIFRIRVLLKHRDLKINKINKKAIMQIGDYSFDYNRLLLIYGENSKKLSRYEGDILRILCNYRDRIKSRKELLIEVWGSDNLLNSNCLYVYITNIRKYLIMDKSVQILNIRSHGYRLLSSPV